MTMMVILMIVTILVLVLYIVLAKISKEMLFKLCVGHTLFGLLC